MRVVHTFTLFPLVHLDTTMQMLRGGLCYTVPSSLMFSPLFLMDMNHHITTQNARANSSSGLVTLCVCVRERERERERERG